VGELRKKWERKAWGLIGFPKNHRGLTGEAGASFLHARRETGRISKKRKGAWRGKGVLGQ